MLPPDECKGSKTNQKAVKRFCRGGGNGRVGHSSLWTCHICEKPLINPLYANQMTARHSQRLSSAHLAAIFPKEFVEAINRAKRE